jgi:hypothetical protein
VQHWIQEPPNTFCDTGIKKLPESWRKCIAVNRNYTEKQCVKLFHGVVNKLFRNEFSFKFEVPCNLQRYYTKGEIRNKITFICAANMYSRGRSCLVWRQSCL